jgi:putative flippase GtrA
VRRFGHFVFVRHRHNWAQLIRFGLVGGTGTLVNMLVVIILKKVGPDYRGIFLDLPFTVYNVRWYHVIVTIAFLVANFWNFWINRRWTFRSSQHASWYAEYPPFLAVGMVGQVLGLGLITALIHPDSIITLPENVFDDSTGFRTKLYWAQLISIAVVMPVTFVVNKLWTFSAVRRGKPVPIPIDPPVPEDGESEVLVDRDAPQTSTGAADPLGRAADGERPPDDDRGDRPQEEATPEVAVTADRYPTDSRSS